MTSVGRVLERDARIAYAIAFGSVARGTSHGHSDLDVAIDLLPGAVLSPGDLGTLLADLERAAGGPVDLVQLHEAPAPLAYRVFRDGVILFERDHRALANRKAQAILDYLDFRPIEDVVVRGALSAAARGR